MHTPTRKTAEPTVRRLSLYLRYLEAFEQAGRGTISSGELAQSGGTTSAQVRKDLSFFGSFGKRGLGYSTHELTVHIREILGLDRQWRLVIIGAGKIGSAVAGHRGFRDRGFEIVGIFDADPHRVGHALGGVTVSDVRHLETEVKRLRADMAVLAMPAESAPEVATRLAKAGVHAILDFSTAQLEVPSDVTVRSVNLALELEVLSFALVNR
ncbi:MAG: redox-sensing transcriptional repressor Rex [Gemmatimonadetes bacterium]|nr:redox-sensing transcriptional repressor Rex [Gemmatimonadota bacterium]